MLASTRRKTPLATLPLCVESAVQISVVHAQQPVTYGRVGYARTLGHVPNVLAIPYGGIQSVSCRASRPGVRLQAVLSPYAAQVAPLGTIPSLFTLTLAPLLSAPTGLSSRVLVVRRVLLEPLLLPLPFLCFDRGHRSTGIEMSYESLISGDRLPRCGRLV